MKKVIFIPKDDIYWDNWGRIVKVFKEGIEYEGELYGEDNLYAETPYYKEVGDSIDIEQVDIIKCLVKKKVDFIR